MLGVLCLFFSSRRRHTRCALLTGFRRVLFRSPPGAPVDAAHEQHAADEGEQAENHERDACTEGNALDHPPFLEEYPRHGITDRKTTEILVEAIAERQRDRQHLSLDRKSTRLNSSH